jgi:asparagine synthase (glutamine-hydrolysing)
MCGIVGIIGKNAPVSADVLERATQSLSHRGPDDGGTIILRHSSRGDTIEIGLGNRRLAILDLSPLGHQPMVDPATGNYIVYNGEVYNFREVRTKLGRAGLNFKSNSDTEVILKAYAHWGENCLAEFRGMFAFAIWDARQNLLFMARDPMGIKPFCYFQSEKYFLFSSEVRTLLATGLVPRTIDPLGLAGYLTCGSLTEPNTLVQGLRSLPPGTCMTWKDGQLKSFSYWDLADGEVADLVNPAPHFNTEDRIKLENELAESLNESVRMQLISDVPVGVFLSGGIDSTSLVAILSQNNIRPCTFSIVFREAEYSEAQYSRAVAQQFRTDHHEIVVSQSDLFTAVDPAISAMDLPTIDGLNTYFVSEKTRAAGVKVALSGLGGDEMFAGYSSFRAVPKLERFGGFLSHVPGPLRHLAGHTFTSFTRSSDQNRKLASFLSGDVTSAYILARMLFTPRQRTALLTPTNGSSASPHVQHLLTENFSRARSLDPVNRVSYLEARCYMLNTLLRDSDFMSMAHGLEVRVPLIDHQLARRVLALPGAWKLDSRIPKPLLVRALRGKLPDNIVHRPKRGFTLPFEHWLRDAMRPVVEKSLSNIADGALGALISQRAAQNVWHDFLAGKTSWTRPWSLYVLQRWCEQHFSS